MTETDERVTPETPEVGSQGWAPLLPLASALGRSIGTLNSWGSEREGQLPKIEQDGEILACVATAKYLHAHCAADREPTRIKADGRIYRSISALCSEVAMPHGDGLREARARLTGAKTDFPDCFMEGAVTFCDADAFRGWAARQGYARVTWSTLPVLRLTPQARQHQAPPTATPARASWAGRDIDEALKRFVDDALELSSRIEDFRLSLKKDDR